MAPTDVQRVAAYGLVRSAEGDVLLVRSASTAPLPDTWFLPGGGVEHGEHPAETVVRELAEETGLTATVRDLVGVYSTVTELDGAAPRIHTVALVYGIDVPAHETLRDGVGPDGETPEWLAPDEAQTLMLSPVARAVLATAP
jgi:8-oxo-dGTP pyrophosphatase MutT (NUDIX family)